MTRKLTKEQRDELRDRCSGTYRPGWKDVVTILNDLDEADRELEQSKATYVRDVVELRAKLAEELDRANRSLLKQCEYLEQLGVAREALETYAQFARNGETTMVSGYLAQTTLAKLGGK